jgi:hypothetical protein
MAKDLVPQLTRLTPKIAQLLSHGENLYALDKTGRVWRLVDDAGVAWHWKPCDWPFRGINRG